MKSLTLKQFWTILEKADMPRDIYGLEGILNILCIGEWSEADRQKARGCKVLEDLAVKRANIIHDSLADLGYFKD